MAKTKNSSWLPKGKAHRSSASGQFVAVKRASGTPATSAKEPSGGTFGKVIISKPGKGSSLLRNIRLPNGDVITTVRGDVMDRALRRGDFKRV